MRGLVCQYLQLLRGKVHCLERHWIRIDKGDWGLFCSYPQNVCLSVHCPSNEVSSWSLPLLSRDRYFSEHGLVLVAVSHLSVTLLDLSSVGVPGGIWIEFHGWYKTQESRCCYMICYFGEREVCGFSVAFSDFIKAWQTHPPSWGSTDFHSAVRVCNLCRSTPFHKILNVHCHLWSSGTRIF